MRNPARILSRHEIGDKQIKAILDWKKRLEQITHIGGSVRHDMGVGDTRHFHIELKRVNKFIKNLPK